MLCATSSSRFSSAASSPTATLIAWASGRTARRFRYVLQCDVQQFFLSIDHAILSEILARTTRDPAVMWLVERILESGIDVLSVEYRMVRFAGDDLFAVSRPRGLPIGNLTSQFWANCYLNPFDHFAKRRLRCPGYIRYVDDFLLFGDDEATLWMWRDEVVERLAALRLTIHPGAHPRPVEEGIPFLGFVVYPERRRLKRRTVVSYGRLRALAHSYLLGDISLGQLTASTRGWFNHTRYGNTVGLRKAVFGSMAL